MKQYRSLLILNAVFYAIEGLALIAWYHFWPFSWFTFWYSRLGLLP